MEQNILTILGVVIALAEIAVAICKYSQETRQKSDMILSRHIMNYLKMGKLC